MGRPSNPIPSLGDYWANSLTIQSKVIKFPTVGACLSLVKPSYNLGQLPNRGVVGHNIDRHINKRFLEPSWLASYPVHWVWGYSLEHGPSVPVLNSGHIPYVTMYTISVVNLLASFPGSTPALYMDKLGRGLGTRLWVYMYLRIIINVSGVDDSLCCSFLLTRHLTRSW